MTDEELLSTVKLTSRFLLKAVRGLRSKKYRTHNIAEALIIGRSLNAALQELEARDVEFRRKNGITYPLKSL